LNASGVSIRSAAAARQRHSSAVALDYRARERGVAAPCSLAAGSPAAAVRNACCTRRRISAAALRVNVFAATLPILLVASRR
jgi:hypothetical protein